jgi:restriction endonuclease
VDSTDKAQEAIKALNPLCTLRYSATHVNPYNLVYRLDPIRAFDLKLVKQIVVGSAKAEGAANPDWAILKQDGLALYLVRETKGTRDYLKLRTSEADKVRCGEKHFDAIGVPFDVVVSADDV